ncbi:hypothetical protein [Bacillus sp. 1P06AnD]
MERIDYSPIDLIIQKRLHYLKFILLFIFFLLFIGLCLAFM